MFDSALTAHIVCSLGTSHIIWKLNLFPFARMHEAYACKLANYQPERSSWQAVLDQGLLSLVQLCNQLWVAKLGCMEAFNQAEGWPSPRPPHTLIKHSHMWEIGRMMASLLIFSMSVSGFVHSFSCLLSVKRGCFMGFWQPHQNMWNWKNSTVN